jgi:hypothetical protein
MQKRLSGHARRAVALQSVLSPCNLRMSWAGEADRVSATGEPVVTLVRLEDARTRVQVPGRSSAFRHSVTSTTISPSKRVAEPRCSKKGPSFGANCRVWIALECASVAPTEAIKELWPRFACYIDRITEARPRRIALKTAESFERYLPSAQSGSLPQVARTAADATARPAHGGIPAG